jgi:hypothetical protein
MVVLFCYFYLLLAGQGQILWMDNVGWMAMGLRVIDIGWLDCYCDTAGCRAYTSEDHKMGGLRVTRIMIPEFSLLKFFFCIRRGSPSHYYIHFLLAQTQPD